MPTIPRNRTISPADAMLLALVKLLHFEPQQTGFGTTRRGSIITVAFVKGIAAGVESLNSVLAFGLVVVVLGQAVLTCQLHGRHG